MAAKLTIAEIFAKLKEFTGDGAVTKKVEWLKQHDSPTLRMLLKHGFDPNLQYSLPEGDPPFRRNPNPVGLTETNLFAETRKLSYLWLEPSKTALMEMTDDQKARLNAAEEIEETAGREFLNADNAFKAAEQELTDAKQALLDANARVNKATAAVQEARQQYNASRANAERIAQQVAALRQNIQRTNNELLKRETPPVVTMPAYKREMMFIQMLEALHPTEADVVLAVKSKTLAKKYALTKDIVKKAFPDVIK